MATGPSSTSKIRGDALLPGSRSRRDHRPFTAISVILQHAAILNTYCRVEAYEHEPYGGKEGEEDEERERKRMYMRRTEGGGGKRNATWRTKERCLKRASERMKKERRKSNGDGR